MSTESSLNHNSGRSLREEETALLRSLLEDHPSGKSLLGALKTASISDLRDGGMGSIQFNTDSAGERRMSQCVAEADYVDADGVSVSIAVNIDERGQLFELDLWRVDFAPLAKYPTPTTIRNVRHFPIGNPGEFM
jgi:hypothetical protein